MLEFSIMSIAAFVAAGNECIKLIARSLKKDWNKFIPICSLVIGVILGVSGYFIPNVNMGNNIVEAIFIGLAAGASATGVHQVGKQLTKKEDNQELVIPVDTLYEAMKEDETITFNDGDDNGIDDEDYKEDE